jgi:hypothetical protein
MRSSRSCMRSTTSSCFLVFGVDRCLKVVSHDTGAATAGGHRTGVRVRERDLPVRRRLHLGADLDEAPHLLLDSSNLLFEPGHTLFIHRGGLAICTVQFRKVARNAFFQLFHARLQFAVGEVLVTIVDRLELAAVDGNDGLREQAQVPAQDDKLPANATNGGTVVIAEIGDGLEVRRQAARRSVVSPAPGDGWTEPGSDSRRFRALVVSTDDRRAGPLLSAQTLGNPTCRDQVRSRIRR